jgi:5'-nucleotidase
MLNRRKFISKSALAAGSFLIAPSLAEAAETFASSRKLIILHTNDTHSRIDPFPMDGGRNQGLGGVAARSGLIKKINSEEENVLLFDAGDIFQGTPYFNIFKGEPEIKSMAKMGYHAATIGNHDFDAGLQVLRDQLDNHASFPMIICNYDFSGTPMEGKTIPYKIFKKNNLKIGVTGVGIELKGLVEEKLIESTQYLNPISRVNEVAYELKRQNCDLVVCLSHLGYKYSYNKVSDVILAEESENIDLIIGGHTHTFLEKPDVVKNKKGEDVLINQVGWAGIQLGRLDFIFEKNRKKTLTTPSSILVTKKYEI